MPLRHLTPEEIAREFGGGRMTETPRAGLGTRFGAAVDDAQAMLYGVGEAAGLPLGNLRRANQAEADASRQRYFLTNPDAPQSYRDVDGIRSAGRYALGLGTDSLPVMGAIAAGGLVGGPGGAVLAGTAFGAGDILQNQREAAGETNLAEGVTLGAGYGAMDSMTGVAGALARRSLRSTGLKALDEVGVKALDGLTGVKGGLARTGVAMAKHGLTEGAGETGQEVFNQLGRMGVNGTVRINDADAMDRYAESFVGGAALGGVFGGVGGWRRSAQPIQTGETRDLLNNEPTTAPGLEGVPQQRPGLRPGFDPRLGDLTPDWSTAQGFEGLAQDNRAHDYEADKFVGPQQPGPRFRPPAPVAGIDTSGLHLAVGEDRGYGFDGSRGSTAQLQMPGMNLQGDTVYVDSVGDARGGPNATGGPQDAALMNDPGAALARQAWLKAQGEKVAIAEKKQELADRLAQANAALGTQSKSWNRQHALWWKLNEMRAAGTISQEQYVEQMANLHGDKPLNANAASSFVRDIEKTSAATALAKAADEQAKKPADAKVTAAAPAPVKVNSLQEAANVLLNDAPAPANAPAAPSGQTVAAPAAATAAGGAPAAVQAAPAPAAPAAPAVAVAPTPVVAPAPAAAPAVKPPRRAENGAGDIVERVKAAGRKAVIGGAIDFTALKDILEPLDPRMHHAVRLHLGVDKDGNRLDKPLSMSAAAQTAGIGKSHDKVSKVLKELGIDKAVRDRYTASSAQANERADGDIETAEEPSAEVEVAETGTRLLSDETTDDRSSEDRDISPEKGFGVVQGGGSQGKVESEKSGSMRSADWYKRIAAAGGPRSANDRDLITGAIKGAQYAETAENKQDLLALMQEVERRARNPEFARALKRAYEVEYDSAPVAEAKQEDSLAEDDGLSDVDAERDGEQAPARTGRSVQEPRAEGDSAQRQAAPAPAPKVVVKKPAPKVEPGQGATAQDAPAAPAEAALAKSESKLFPGEVERLENHYGTKRGSKKYWAKLQADVVALTTKGVEAVHGAIRSVVKKVAEGVLAVGLVLNPAAFNAKFDFNLPQTYRTTIVKTVQERAVVPANAVAQMSPDAIAVYEAMAPTAADSGKGFMIADKKAGMLHIFNADGSLFAQEAALFGAGKGDSLDAPGAHKVTPAGAYSLQWTNDPEYAGGSRLDLVGSSRGGGIIAVHAAWLGNPKDNRLGRLKSASAEDNRISYGCINTSHDLFLKKLLPNISSFNGGMILVLPEESSAAEMFPARTLATEVVEQEVVAGSASENERRGQQQDGIERGQRAARSASTRRREGPVEMKLRADERAFFDGLNEADRAELMKAVPSLKIEGDVLLVAEEDVDALDNYIGSRKGSVPESFSSTSFDFVRRLASARGVRTVAAGDLKLYSGQRRDMGELDSTLQGVEIVEAPLARITANVPSVRAAIENLRASSGLGYLIDQVSSWHVVRSETDKFGAAYTVIDGQPAVILNLEYLQDEANATHAIAHELGHVADGYEEVFSGMGELNLHRDRTSGKVRGVGAVAREIAAFYEANPKSAFAVTMRYPLGRANMNNGTTRSEVFAQLWALWASPAGRAFLRANLPVTANFMESAYETHQEYAAQEANERAAEVEEALAPRRQAQGENRSAAGAVRAIDAQALTDMARRTAGPSGAILATDVGYVAKKLGQASMFLHDLVDRYKASLPSMGKWYAAMQNQIATRNRLEQDAERIAVMAEKLDAAAQGRVNAFIAASTVEQKWGYDPKTPGKTVTVDADMAKQFAALKPAEQEVVRAVFAHGEKMKLAKREALAKADLADKEFTPAGALEGPYAPLKRFGNFVAVLKSAELQQAEAAGDDKRAEELKRDPKHYVVSTFDTPGQAAEFVRENGKGFAYADSFRADRQGENAMRVKDETLRKVLAALGLEDNLDPQAKANVEKLVRDMYFQSLDEGHARTSGLHRKNRAGYEADMIRSFLAHARSEAAFLASIQHGKEINQHFYAMKREAHGSTDRRNLTDAVDTASQHYSDSLSTQETPWQDRAVALTSAWQLMTSVGYHVANATQPFMATIPKLGSDFGDYAGAWRHVTNAYNMLREIGMRQMDLSKVKDEGLRAALQKAADMGVLDVGMDEDLTQFTAMRTGIGAVDTSTKVARGALHKLRQVSRWVETANRVSSAVAAYRMAREHGRSVEQAQEYAVNILQTTQGDFSRVGAPLVLKKLPKVVTQYRKYQFMMAALYVKAFQQAVWGSPEEKAIGRRMLAFKLFHTSMAAGALGLPLMNLAALVWAGLAGDDDEPADLERDLRRWIGDDTMADILLKGPLNMIGLDMSAKLGDDKVFSILPYTDVDFSSAQGVRNTVAGAMGPAVAQLGKWADAIGYMSRGDYYKGVEKTLPKGLESAAAAFRVANEGYTLKNGDVMVSPEAVNEFALVLDGLGLKSSHLKRMEWLRNQQYEVGEFFQGRTKDITREYVRAIKDGDSEAAAQAREDWKALQEAKDRLRPLFNDSKDALKKSPLSTLLKAPKNADKREGRLQASVSEED